MSVVYINSYQFSAAAPALTTWDIGITTTDGNWSLRTESTCNYDVDWGDGQTDTNVSATGTFVKSHTYASSGSYTVKVKLNSGVFRPRFDYGTGSSNAEVVSLGATPPGWSFGTDLSQAFYALFSLSSVSANMDTSAVTTYFSTWLYCTNLASFPLLDTSRGTSFTSTWQDCTSLTSFPLITTSSGTSFTSTWRNCTSLTSFPLLDTSRGTNFASAWRNCTSLVSFPASFFDNWTATPASNCFYLAWAGCTSLSATSVKNILNSIATSGRSPSGTGTSVTITIDYNASSGTPSISSAVSTLKSRGWIIVLNGVTQ
jgi:hypothetical protein